MIIIFLTERYQVLGRQVHMNYVEEYLRTKKQKFLYLLRLLSDNIVLEIHADTVYVMVSLYRYIISCFRIKCQSFKIMICIFFFFSDLKYKMSKFEFEVF